MKIMISGSMTFSKQMIELKAELDKLGHTALLPIGIEPHLEDASYQDDLERNTSELIQNDIMRKNFNQLSEQEAILVFNKSKNNIDGYMGVSMLMEMAIAYFLGKKIFLWSDIPHFNEHRWAHEVLIMQPTFIKGDLTKIV